MSVHTQEPPGLGPAMVSSPAGGSALVTALFATTSLVGAGLLFVVQPMVARLVLPSYGGSASVWSTSSLLFQVVLLAGYVYAHATTQRLGPRQPLLHLAVLLLPLAVLPVVLPADAAPPADASPVLWLLRTLLLTIGLPFAVISTTGPLLQRWYSWTPGRRSDDPYFLFATSNLGSFGGLLAYPFLVEPFLTLQQQRLAWSWGFVALVVLMGACALVAARGHRQGSGAAPGAPAGDPTDVPRPGGRVVAGWLLLSFLPSTLMLGVTAHISTDVASIPLLWVVPLAIYLATFVLAFARTSRRVDHRTTGAAVAVATMAGLAYVVSGSRLPLWLPLGVDLLLLATAGYAAHARLAAGRPHPVHLTRFYLVVATGGALGGLLNGLVAPLLLPGVWEYPLAIVGVLVLGARSLPSRRLLKRYHPAFAVVAAAAVAGVVLLLTAVGGAALAQHGPVLAVAGVVLWVAVALPATRLPGVVAVGLALAVLAVQVQAPDAVYRDRTFYGSYRVVDNGDSRQFVHGTTVHGLQLLGADSSRPTTYYARSGPVGDVFASPDAPGDVGVVGLGVGTIATYLDAGESITFYEIDPEVVRVAEDPSLFTFLSDAAADVDTVVGDGRLRLGDVEEGAHDALFLDAFTSDAIPVHLLTREAFDVYARALRPGGLLMVHVSNRVFDLEPVVAADADHLGWSVAVGDSDGGADGGTPSRWIALSDDPARIDALLARPGWHPADAERRPWTDDFSSVLTVLR